MRVTFANYEYVDEVHTLTLAEGPGEAGTLVHFMRATWEDDRGTHEVCNASHDSVDGAVRAWAWSASALVVAFHEHAAAKLGFPSPMSLQLDMSEQERLEVRQRLADILIDVQGERLVG
jgi:hypothetical protein